jgi:hypothetical protein
MLLCGHSVNSTETPSRDRQFCKKKKNKITFVVESYLSIFAHQSDVVLKKFSANVADTSLSSSASL